MRPLHFLGRALAALAGTLLLLLIAAALFVAWRLATAGQTDDPRHLEAKRAYLAELAARGTSAADPPSIVFILYDDLGYADLDLAGREDALIATPHIAELARGGVVLTDFHSPAAVCTPSRAGYLTGRLAPRAGLPDVVFPTGSGQAFLFSVLANPERNVRLPAEEITLAELLRAAGYATGMVGKWHLGDRSPSLPNDMGFDSYFGALYSNDMEPFALYRNRDIAVTAPADQRYLTERYTRAAVEFIESSRGGPLFLYVAHNFPHDPLHVREARAGRSRAGLYGDVVEELDDSVGEIVAALKRSDRLDNTLLIVTSDNGPWFLGDPGELRGRKGNTFEGGLRVPFVAHWPARIAAGRSEPAMAMGTDLLPTVLEMLDLPPPPDRILDGRSLLAVLTRGAPTPHDYLYYIDGETLFAVRDQRFKYRAPAGVFYATDQMPVAAAMQQKAWLFDLLGDPRESYDTASRHPRDLARLRAAFDAKLADMTDNPRGWR